MYTILWHDDSGKRWERVKKEVDVNLVYNLLVKAGVVKEDIYVIEDGHVWNGYDWDAE